MGVLEEIRATMTHAMVRLRGGTKYKYTSIPIHNVPGQATSSPESSVPERRNRFLQYSTMAMLGLVAVYIVFVYGRTSGCSFPGMCKDSDAILLQLWGQYSPYFPVPSEIDPSIPPQCDITFVQVLSRHGARDPTLKKTESYNATIAKIKANAISYGKGYEFLRDFDYRLGADQLTFFGEKQMVDSGLQFYQRYRRLIRDSSPFLRSSGQDRVKMSAFNWTQGFAEAMAADGKGKTGDGYDGNILLVPEEPGINNTLNHGLCTAFETGPFAHIGDDAQAEWRSIFAPSILSRLQENLPGVDLDISEVISFMDLCAFETVATPDLTISPFCRLFTLQEWKDYNYYQTLGKYYAFHEGNPLGPSQGVGFANELIARLTHSRVKDHTSTNSTTVHNPTVFPLNRTVYADFSHDSDMVAIYAALGLYHLPQPLPKTERTSPRKAAGFSTSWAVPFAARMYVETMRCSGHETDLVRILVNDRVVPLPACDSDALGRCPLDAFVESLRFAKSGGHWDQCFE